MAEKLVLWKPVSQRRAEALIIPLILLPVGPAMRNLTGDAYDPFYALAVWMALLFLTTLGGRRWALRHGGEWVTAAERLQRFLAEISAVPRWQAALLNGAMYAAIFFALMLVVNPISDFGSGLGGPWAAAGIIGLISSAAVLPVLTGRYKRLASVPIEESASSAKPMLSDWLRLLPRFYLAHALSTAAGVIIALQLPGTLRFGVLLGINILGLQLLRLLPVFNRTPRRLYASFSGASLWIYLLYGVAFLGMPFTILFGGFAFLLLEAEPTPIPAALVFGLVAAAGVLFGVLVSTLIYLNNRLLQRQSAKGAT